MDGRTYGSMVDRRTDGWTNSTLAGSYYQHRCEDVSNKANNASSAFRVLAMEVAVVVAVVVVVVALVVVILCLQIFLLIEQA